MSSFGTYLGICRDCQPHREVHEEGRATLNHITAVTLLNLQYQYKLLFIGMLYRDVCLYNMSVCVLFVLVSRYKVHLEQVGQVAPGLIPENFFFWGMFGIAQCFSTFIPYHTTLHCPPGKYHQKIILGWEARGTVTNTSKKLRVDKRDFKSAFRVKSMICSSDLQAKPLTDVCCVISLILPLHSRCLTVPQPPSDTISSITGGTRTTGWVTEI